MKKTLKAFEEELQNHVIDDSDEPMLGNFHFEYEDDNWMDEAPDYEVEAD